jgi:hypothetical protein
MVQSVITELYSSKVVTNLNGLFQLLVLMPQYLQLEAKDFDKLCGSEVYFISRELSKNNGDDYNFCGC